MGDDDDGNGRQGQASPTPRSSDRALALLTAVIETEGEPSLTQLSAQVDLAPSTASRQLASLEAAGMVARGATGYVVGPTMVRLAHRVVGARPVAQLAQPILDDLAATTGESAYLAVGHDDVAAIYVAAAEGTHHLRHAGWRGRTVPRATTAVGAALAGTPATVHDAIETGITAIAAPVATVGGPAMAIVVLGPTFRLEPGHGAAMDAVLAAATALGELVGAT
ncbi:MAG TPA: helix-turn-helix domain-containing protein [Nitriliruptoraceae bacterium]|nr:helix-turn-helix domain-containing protein [Nitriliruptoraceae bacterium]